MLTCVNILTIIFFGDKLTLSDNYKFMEDLLMKKLLALGLILSTLTSLVSVCFASDGNEDIGGAEGNNRLIEIFAGLNERWARLDARIKAGLNEMQRRRDPGVFGATEINECFIELRGYIDELVDMTGISRVDLRNLMISMSMYAGHTDVEGLARFWDIVIGI